MSESSIVWRTLKNKMSRDVWLQRIENSVGRGTPDVWFSSVEGRSGWIELKYAPKRLTTPRTTFRVSPAQYVFAMKCKAHDIPYFLIGAYQEEDKHRWCFWDDIEGWNSWTWQDATPGNWFGGERFEPLTVEHMMSDR